MKKKRYSDLVFIVLLMAVSWTSCLEGNPDARVGICDHCKCSNVESLDPDVESFLRIECVHKKNTENISLSSVKWPESKENIVVSVQGFEMISAQKLAKSEYVMSISLNYNNIRTMWPKAFEDVPNLKMLSLANNNLNEVLPDMFVNLKLLKELDLSDNQLREFNKLDFQHLKSLDTLILSGNKLEHVPINALNGISSLENLYLSRNEIFLLKFEEASESWARVGEIKILDFSFNKLTIITKETFQGNQKLEYLNLSNNNIKNIEADAFIKCESLQTIDLSSNDIKSLSTFAPVVKTILLNKNSLSEWPQFPETVHILDISENNILSVYNENDINFKNIEVLNISKNHLQSFDITRPLPQLTILDISYNNFEIFPKNFDSNLFPSIEDLSIDGNPIKELVFENTLFLRRFSASYLNEITEIKKSNLKLKAKSPISSENKECIDVYISHCQNLKNIESSAFDDLPLCHLDLSFNKLKTLSRSEKFKTIGMNLQGNPWACTCELQWVLDDLLEQLYEKHPLYLHELRCEAPRHFMGVRFVHFYQWGERAFCSDAKARKAENYMIAESSDSSSNEDMMVILLFVAIVVLGIVVGALVTYLLRGRWRHRQRLEQIQTAKRRQAASDKKKETNNGEYNALTTV